MAFMIVSEHTPMHIIFYILFLHKHPARYSKNKINFVSKHIFEPACPGKPSL
jgi:hypothetical protein